MWKHSRTARSTTPTYFVEHLATFRVGPQFGVQWPEDGIKKLKEMEKTSNVWAQKLNLKLSQDTIVLEDENGDLVERFPKNLVSEPFAYTSGAATTSTIKRVGDYDNLLILKVSEPPRSTFSSATTGVASEANFPAEMHIFRCPRHSASEVAAAINQFLTSTEVPLKPEPTQDKSRVIPVPVQIETTGPAGYSHAPGAAMPSSQQQSWAHTSRRRYKRDDGGDSYAATQFRTRRASGELPTGGLRYQQQLGGPRTDAAVGGGIMSRSYSEHPIGTAFDSDVNTLNCYIDDIERFVARVQSALAAQRDLSQLRQQREATLTRRRNAPPPFLPPPSASESVLQSRAVLPSEPEYVDVLTKFKYCFNMLGKLQPHIHDPDAPQLIRYLFSPLLVILDAARWSLNKDVAPQITYPPITRDAHLLLSQSLSQREFDTWMSLGDAWKNFPEISTSAMPTRPTFGTLQRERRGLIHHGYSVSDIDRLRSYEEVEAEARHLAEKERLLKEKEVALERLERRLNQDRDSLRDTFERVSLDQPPRDTANVTLAGSETLHRRSRSSHRADYPYTAATFSRQRAFFDQLKERCPNRMAIVTHDRIGQNDKELTVSTGDYLEVLNDSRNWWQCRDAYNAVGFVPNTILNRVPLEQPYQSYLGRRPDDVAHLQQPISVKVPPPPQVQPLNYEQSDGRRLKEQSFQDRGQSSRYNHDRTITFNGNRF